MSFFAAENLLLNRLQAKAAAPLRTVQYNLNGLKKKGLVTLLSKGVYAIPGYERNEIRRDRQIVTQVENLGFYLRRGWTFVAAIQDDSAVIQRNQEGAYSFEDKPAADYEFGEKKIIQRKAGRANQKEGKRDAKQPHRWRRASSEDRPLSSVSSSTLSES